MADAFAALRAYADAEEGFTCLLSDAMGRAGAMGAEVRPMWAGARLVGRAVTARAHGGDLHALFAAIERAEPGDVVVVQGPGAAAIAFWGENASLAARARGAVGAVLGAPIRDVAAHPRLGFPVFATGATPAGGVFGERGAVQVPVVVGGLVVRPGDALVGDENGVVVVPSEDLAAVVAAVPEAIARDRAAQVRWAGPSTGG
ncbi:MAG: RraA family protein [Trueperaceae bacterium]|nr:RraA family protein [Trueperaceae bacterium]